MAVMLAASLTTFVGATPVASSGDIDVIVGIENYVFEVTLPGNGLTFNINPYAVNNDLIDDSQITADAFRFINLTNEFAVRVTVEIEVATAAGVSLVDADDEELTDDDGKAIYLAVVGAYATEGSLYLFDIDKPGTVIDFDTDEGTATIDFALAIHNTAPTSANHGAFTFYGLVTEEADWDGDDIDLTITYRLRPISETRFKDLSTVGLNVMTGGGAGNVVGFGTLPTVAGINFNYNDTTRVLIVNITNAYTTATNIVIPFRHLGETVDASQTNVGTTVPADRGVWNQSAGTFTALSARMQTAINAAAGTFTWDIILRIDNVNYTIRFVRVAS
jgi:hypothetical protein